MKATAIIYFDTRRSKKDNTFPISIKVTSNRIRKYFLTKYSLSEVDYKKLMAGFRLSEAQVKIKSDLNELVRKASGIIDTMEPFTFEAFTLRFTQQGNKSDLIYLLKNKSEILRSQEKLSNSNLYNQAAVILTRYNATITNSNILPINTVNAKWLQAFEVWALKQKRFTRSETEIFEYSKTTLSMYLIRVRAIFNEVITNKELNASLYPFHKADNKSGYKIPKSSNNKRALSLAEIMLIYNYQTKSASEQFAKDFFIFSYLSSGMNMVDIFRLKWSDIQNNQFTFIRKKTENKTGGANKITINLNEDLQSIVDNYGTRKISNSYVFNVLPANATEKETLQKVRSKIASVNTSLKKIAEKVGITTDISTYYARHSFANNQMNAEVPLAYISKQLGHSNLAITQDYLDSFTTEKSVEYQSNLLDKKVS